MLGALLYLRITSLKNWMRSRVRRLRQPKYLVGAIVGFGYFYMLFFRGLAGPPHSMPPGIAQPGLPGAMGLPMDWFPATAAFAALGLLFFFTCMWVVPTGPAALGFTEAEIAFLFPAPVTRRVLVHFRLLSAQFRSLMGAIFMMVFSNRWSLLGGNAVTHAIGWWFIFSALNLHYGGASFALTRLASLGLGTWRRRLLVLAAVAAVIAMTIGRLPSAERMPAIGDTFNLRPIATWGVALASTPPLSWLLWPLKLLLAPFLASDTRAFLLALAPALAVITAHYLWVVHTAVEFEDASLERAQKRSARVAAWRAGNRRIGGAPERGRNPPFRLGSLGRPEFAFLWKNLLSTWPYFTVRIFAISAFVIAALCTWINTQPAWRGFLPAIAIPVSFFAAYTLIVGPQFARQDIRSDLPNTDILKTYPLAGWQIVLGELLTPAAILTGILWLAVLTIALTFRPPADELAWLTPQLRVATTLALAAITPALVLLQLLVPNAAALLFPGWVQASRSRGGGPEMVGQRMIFFFAQLVTMVFALLPAAVMATTLLYLLVTVLGIWQSAAVLIAAAAVLVVLIAEVSGALWWLGHRFEKLDLSAELRA